MKKSSLFSLFLIFILAAALFIPALPAAAASSWTVTSGDNAGNGTLRYFLESNSSVQAGDTIVFAAGVTEINLTSTLNLNKALVIHGELNAAGTPAVSLSGNSGSRLMSLSAAATLENLAFTNSGSGGALAISADAVIDHCVFTGNTAGAGGAISNMVASPTIRYCVFSGNATPAAYGSGGAIYNNTASPLISDCTFTANSAGGEGGALYNVSSSPQINDCVFSGNQAGNLGGAVYNNTGNPVFSNCAVISNTAVQSGGAVYNVSVNPLFTGCLFQNNQTTSASGTGGAVYAMTAPMTFTNCTFCANQAATGGAFYNHQSAIQITNSILYEDSSELGRPSWQSEAYYSVTYSDIQGGYTGTGNIDADPCFVSTTDLHLRSTAGHYTTSGWVTDADTSPCLDSGNPLSDYSNEVSYPLGQIEMGVYGNTAEASLTAFTLTTTVIGPGSLEVTPLAGAAQQTFVLTARPDSGQVFSGWQGDLSGALNPVELVMTGNKSVTAVFGEENPQYTLTIQRGHGEVTMEPDQKVFSTGETVQLCAAPDPGFVFFQWNGDIGPADPAANPLTLVMDQDREISAEYIAEGSWWYLDHFDEMEKGSDPERQFGTLELTSGAAVLWTSRAAAGQNLVFDAGGWTGVINSTDPQLTLQAGACGGSDPADFQPLPGEFQRTVRQNADGGYTLVFRLETDQAWELAAGEYLAVFLTGTGEESAEISTDGFSYLITPDQCPSLPVPEWTSGLLLLLGLAGLSVYLKIRRSSTNH